jgi:hypothetical protein
MLEKISELLKKANERGIILPLLSNKGVGSYTLTCYWVSFNLCIVGLIGKWTDKLNIEYSNVLWFYGVSAAIYLGRNFSSGKNGIDVGGGSSSQSSEKEENS